jgi:predicted DNA-binding protein with PD1-like motif
MELVSLTGNVTWVDDAPLIHAHAVLAGPDYVAYGGHLFSAEIAVTGEVSIAPFTTRVCRKPDERTGLNLIGD